MERYLRPTYTIEKDHPEVISFADAAAGNYTDPVRRAVGLFYAVRDGIRYDPYAAVLSLEKFRASYTIAQGRHFCVPKAILLAACARSMDIPARIGFADVRNHLASARLLELMGTDLFVYHGYTELHLEGRWVKATPTFNIELCERFGVRALEFDGRRDAIFHPFDVAGKKHMDYVHERGHRDDFDLAEMEAVWREHYPHYFDTAFPRGSWEAEIDLAAESKSSSRGQ